MDMNQINQYYENQDQLKTERLWTEGESEVETSCFLTSLKPTLTNPHWSRINNIMIL